jgi:hypothetical protein
VLRFSISSEERGYMALTQQEMKECFDGWVGSRPLELVFGRDESSPSACIKHKAHGFDLSSGRLPCAFGIFLNNDEFAERNGVTVTLESFADFIEVMSDKIIASHHRKEMRN